MITEENKQKNYEIFLKKIEEIGVSRETIEGVFGDKLLNATYAIDTNSGLAYEGSLLNVVLRTLTPYAIKINEMLPENIKVEKSSVIKICLLQHLAKTEMFVKNDNQWEIDKLGKVFKYNPRKIALRLGARSIAISFKLGITLSDVEIEAMTIIDKDCNDEQKVFANPLSVIVKQANEWVTTENLFK